MKPLLAAEMKEKQREAGALYGENHPKSEVKVYRPEAPTDHQDEGEAERSGYSWS
jgi:hypothetical protein